MRQSPRDYVVAVVGFVGVVLLTIVGIVFFSLVLVIDTIGDSRCWSRLRRWWTGGKA
jgi:hypothetical protein